MCTRYVHLYHPDFAILAEPVGIYFEAGEHKFPPGWSWAVTPKIGSQISDELHGEEEMKYRNEDLEMGACSVQLRFQ